MTRRSYEEYRADGALANLEEDWLAEIESDPTDIDWYLGVARGLADSGDEARARDLLELYDAELASRGFWTLRLELLRRAGAMAVKPARLQREVVATLEKIWEGRPTLAAAITHVHLDKATDDPARLWDKVTRLQSLLVYDVGEIVLMQGQGVGRVVEINLPLDSLKIDFEKRSGVTVGLRAAAKMLKPLPPGHLLRRKLEEPEALARLAEENPPELLRAVLESGDKPMTGAEIREMVAGIVPESRWTSWWAAARKHPQVVASAGGRQAYRWEASQAGALAAVRKAFGRADPRGRIDLLRKNVDRDPALAREMAGDLASTAGEAASSDPGLAFEIWFALERADLLPGALESLPDRLLAADADARKLLGGIEDRLLRERALEMLRERRADWVAIWSDHLQREEEPRVLDLLVRGLGDGDPTGRDRLLDDLVAQPRKAPAAFVWLAERAAEDEALRARAPQRLLQALLAALADSQFTRFRVRLRALTESGATLPRLFAHFDEETAPAAAEAIRRSSGLEAYSKDPLLAALELRFPSLRGDGGGAGPLYATAESIEAKRAELKRLTEVEIPANRKAIAEARAMGDLRENFEYKSARDRHEYLNARLASLHRDLGRARPIDFSGIDASEVRIGARVRLEGGGKPRTFTVLGPWESQPEAGVLSYESELGKKLIGRKVGDQVRVGNETLTVAAIEPAR